LEFKTDLHYTELCDSIMAVLICKLFNWKGFSINIWKEIKK